MFPAGEDQLQRARRGDQEALGRRLPRQQVRCQGRQAGEDQSQGARSEDRINFIVARRFGAKFQNVFGAKFRMLWALTEFLNSTLLFQTQDGKGKEGEKGQGGEGC